MFERFNERARKVVVLAQEESQHFNHNYIGTEHLLLGLLRVDGEVAALALNSLNVTLDKAREQVGAIVGYGEDGTGDRGLPFTPRSKRVLELSLREALQLGHNYIGTEHILLGLVQESEMQESELLLNLGVDPDEVRREVVRRLSGGRAQSRRRRESQRSKPEREEMKAPSGFELRHTLREHNRRNIRAIAWSPDGRRIASGSSDATVCVWDACTGRVLQTRQDHIGPINSVAWSPDGRTLASGGADSTIQLWDVEQEGESRTFQGNDYAISSIAWAPPGNRPVIALGASDGRIRLWNTVTGEVQELGKHEGWVNRVAWSPDGKILASGGADSTIQLWDIEGRTRIHILRRHSDGISDIIWSPDGEMIVSAAGEADPTIRVWDPQDGRQTNVLEGHSKGIASISFSADSRLLASKSYDSKVLLWQTGAWLPAAELPESADPNGRANLAFHPSDPHVLATFGEDDTVIGIWELDLAELLSGSKGETAKVTSAKVMLVGESNVGKSWLAMRLATGKDPSKEQIDTTHGMQRWWVNSEQLNPTTADPEGERRHVVLWDMGGQDEYRLVHQLFLGDNALALVFLDPTRGRTAFADVRAWNKRLQKQLGDRPVAKLLVGTKLDEPSELVNSDAIKQLIEECGFARYYETSAFTGRGVDELKKAINEHVDWKSVATTSRLEQFQRIRDEIDRRRDEGGVVLLWQELESTIREVEPDTYNESAVAEVVKQLAVQGLIAKTQLARGEQALVLRVEEIERYAGSLIVAARDNPRGVPALEERDLGFSSLFLPGIKAEDRLPRQLEIFVLECTVALLIEHGICFRHEGLLIFPTLFPDTEIAREEKLPHSVSLYYDFTGAIDNIYASLVTQLSISGKFGEPRLETNRVEFDKPGQGVCGIRQIKRESGFARIDLFFAEDTGWDRREFFISFVEDHLRHHDVEVEEHQAIECRGCGREISEDGVQANIARGHQDVVCFDCGTTTLISEGAKTIREREQESDQNMLALRTDVLRTEIKEQKTKDVEEAKKTVSDKSKQQPADENQPIRILHLSDLHFTKETSPEAKLQGLMDDLKGKNGLGVNSLEYLVVSGDVTDKGRKEGFEKARQFVSQLIDKFDLSAERCILVPGNHDVSDQADVYRPALPEDTHGLDSRLYIERDGLFQIRDEDKYPERFLRFSDDFYHKIVQSPYPLEVERQGIAHLFEETGIQFLTLNSCWEIDHLNRERSGVNTEAVAHVIRRANEQTEKARENGKPEKGAEALRLGVWHHAVAGREMMQNTEFIGNLQKNSVKVWLHGDVHEPRCELIGYRRENEAYIVGAGSFGSPPEGRPESTPRLYNLLEVQRDLSSIRVHTRCQKTPYGPWEGWYEWPPADNREGRVPYYDIEL